jgi:tetratricopeptide (TPR) repeat protein
VTSRDRLDRLETPNRLPVGALSEDDAVAMLCGLGGRGEGDAKLAEIAAVCGRWPLALNAVGTLLRDLSPADLLAAMGDLRRPLDLVPEGERSIRTAFDLSYRALDAEPRTVLHACAWHPGLDYDRASIAAMLDRQKALTPVHLAALVRRNMLVAVDGRYRLHDVFRHVARETAEREAPGGAVTARRRLQEHLLEKLNAALALLQGVEPLHEPDADMGLFPDPLSARDWLTAASPELEAAALAWDEPRPSESDAELRAALAQRTARWFRLDNRTEQALRLTEALERRASMEEDFILMADVHCDLAAAFELRGDYEEAEEHYRYSRSVYLDNGDQRGAAVALAGIATANRLRREHVMAQRFYREAFNRFSEIGDRRGSAYALSGLGHVAVGRGLASAARERYERALELCEQIGDRLGAAEALSGLGRAAVLRDAPEEAAASFREAADRYDAIGVSDAAVYCREQLRRLGRRS